MAATVRAVGLTKVYNLGGERVYALKSVSLDIQQGDMVAIVGRDSSGKSTLLHILGGLQRPDSGQVLIEGVDMTRLEDEELSRVRTDKVGFIFQAFNLLPNETVLDNVAVAIQDRGMGLWDHEEKAEETLRIVGLENRLTRLPGQLPAMQRQCIAIARALVHDPAVIFADEPTKVLDSTSREEVMGLFQRLNDAGMTIVIATTDSSIANYCRRMVRIADGMAVEEGPISRRRIIPATRIPGIAPPSYVRQEIEDETVCSRCSYGNPKDAETCQQCDFPLSLTREEEQSIEARLSGLESRWMGVESTSDEGEVPVQGLIEELKEVPIFSEMSSKDLVKVISTLEQLSFQKGSTIVKQGDVGDSFYVIRGGTVNVVLERSGGESIPVARLGPNETFGEMALLTDRPRAASIIAITDVDTWRLPRAEFEELLLESPSLSIHFNRILIKRVVALQAALIP